MAYYDKLWKRKIPQILFYLGLTVELGIVLIDKSDYINPVEGQLFRLTFLLFAMKLLMTEYTWKEWCMIIILEGVGLISYRITGKNDIIRIVTFVSACKGIPLKQMLRYTFYVTLIGCLAIILLSVSGIYGRMSLTADFGREFNLDTRQGIEETRYTLGMGHPNALAGMYLMLLALGIYVFFERMKWYIYLFLLFLNVGVYKLTDSKTSMIIATLLLCAACLMRYAKFFREKSFAYICGVLVFTLCIVFSVDAAIQAPEVRWARWSLTYNGTPAKGPHVVALLRIDAKLNGRIVSLTDSDRNDGSAETWALLSCPENMDYYFDMGWVKLFYRYGILPGFLYCIACLALLWQFYRKKDAAGLIVFSVLAIYSIVEAHLISVYIGRNFLLMMMGSYFFCMPFYQNPRIKNPVSVNE